MMINVTTSSRPFLRHGAASGSLAAAGAAGANVALGDGRALVLGRALEHRLQVGARGLLPLLHLDGLLVLGGARVLAHGVLLAQHFLQHDAALTGGCWGTGLRRGGGCVIAGLASWCDILV